MFQTTNQVEITPNNHSKDFFVLSVSFGSFWVAIYHQADQV